MVRVSFKGFRSLQTQKRHSGVGNQYFIQLALFGFIVNLKKRCDINNIICWRFNIEWHSGASKIIYSLAGPFLGLPFQFFEFKTIAFGIYFRFFSFRFSFISFGHFDTLCFFPTLGQVVPKFGPAADPHQLRSDCPFTKI